MEVEVTVHLSIKFILFVNYYSFQVTTLAVLTDKVNLAKSNLSVEYVNIENVKVKIFIYYEHLQLLQLNYKRTEYLVENTCIV